MADNVPELTNREFESFTKEGLVLLDFFAEWCMPCVMMAPVLEDLSEKLKGKIKIGKVNFEDNPQLAQKFSISAFPTFVLFKEGKEVNRFIGAMSEDEFEEKLREYL
ncbi:MAG TPA: thioredoxin [Candidatus Pacearchaeota archaeon]|nr:thioredoxin-1 [archaeon BMS3Abin17]HDK42713.1 thioredoxin [Candidatus Pacearchaeota archaeon]HDZ60930.1 thioredoxin [Candidatus Pacearchaeota archaeon]